MEQNTLAGGWSAWNFKSTTEASKVFEESLGKLLGVKYKLVAFASQLVNGTNYAFLCEAEAVTLQSLDHVVLANVHQPIKGQPHITGIKSAGPRPAHIPGGWQNWQFTVTRKTEAILHEATKPLLGVSYKGLAVDTQLVAGMNYCFLCEAEVSIVKASPYPALVWIYQPLQGSPHVEEIQVIHP
jgi:hypothetical protein